MIEVTDLKKTYSRNGDVLRVIDGLDFHVKSGSSMALMGPSGSGKTTILNIIAGLDNDFEGTVQVAGNDLRGMSSTELDRYRNATIGFIFQEFNLLSHPDALENVRMTLMFGDVPHHKAKERGMEALRTVGLEKYWNRMPSELSGGQKQRVAIARALINRPKIILADEPTANLDNSTEKNVLELIVNLAREEEATLVISTHRQDIAAIAETRTVLTEEVSGMSVEKSEEKSS